ncbi:unnamed protein product, partial [Oikopleura dioica]
DSLPYTCRSLGSKPRTISYYNAPDSLVLHPAYEGWRTRRATETWNLKTIDEDDILDNIVMILADFEEDKETVKKPPTSQIDVDNVLEKQESADEPIIDVKDGAENDEKYLRESKNSFLLFDEEKSEDESESSSLCNFIDDSSTNSDNESTVSSMSRLSLCSDEESYVFKRVLKCKLNVQDFGIQTNPNMLTVSSTNVEISKERTVENDIKEINVSSKGIQAIPFGESIAKVPARISIKSSKCVNCGHSEETIMKTIGTQAWDSVALAKSKRQPKRRNEKSKRKRELASSDEDETRIKKRRIILLSSDDEC